MGAGKCISSKGARCCWLCVAITGLVLIAIGVAVGVAFPSAVSNAIKKALVIDSATAAGYDKWVSEEVDPEEDGSEWNLYVFNVTNPSQVAAGARPILRELGPYKYRWASRAVDPVFLENGNKVRFLERNMYVPMALSHGGRDPTEKVTMINPVYLAILQITGGENNVLVSITASVFANVASGLTSNSSRASFLIGGAARYFARVFAQIPSAMLYPHWANATSDGGLPHGLTVSSGNVSAGISSLGAQTAWTVLQNSTLLGAWVTRRSFPVSGVLTTTQNALATQWLLTYISGVVEPALAAAYGCGTSLADVGYAQWASAAPGGSRTVVTAMPNIEYGMWLISHASNATLTVPQAKSLLVALTDKTSVGALLQLGSAGQWASVGALFGLSSWQAANVYQYVAQYVRTYYVLPLFRSYLGTSGLFATKPLQDAVFGGPDSLYTVLAKLPTAAGIFANDTTVASTRARNASQLRWTGKGVLDDICQIIAKRDSEYNTQWGSPVKIEGTAGTQFSPFILRPKAFRPVLWDSNTNRSLTFEYAKYETVRGILPTARYELATDQLWTANPVFYNSLLGFANMSVQNYGVPVFFSPPHMNHNDSRAWRSNYTMSPTVDEDAEAVSYLNIEPFLGTTVRAQTALQFNVLIDARWAAKLSVTHPAIRSNMMVPVGYLISLGQATDKQLNGVKKVLATRAMALAVLPGLVVPGCVLFVAGLALLAYSLHKLRTKRNAVTPVKAAPDYSVEA
eukprot:m51a1_g12343 putative lysosomal integral membrane protein ii (742) ;mRNA; r:515098-517575